MFQESVPGEVVSRDLDSKVGPTVEFDKLKSAAEAGTERLRTYVMEPLRSWLKNFDDAVVRSRVGAEEMKRWKAGVEEARGVTCALLQLTLARSQALMHGVEETRLVLDSRRRSVATLEGASLSQHAARSATPCSAERSGPGPPATVRAHPLLAVWRCSLPQCSSRLLPARAGKLTNVRSKAEDENDPKLQQCIQKKYRQETKMNRMGKGIGV